MFKKIISILIVLFIVTYFTVESIYDFYTYTYVFKNNVKSIHILDLHYTPIEKPDDGYYSTVENITLLKEDNSIDIEFAQPEIQYSNGYKPIPAFTPHFENIKVNQTFVTSCTNFVKDGQAKNFPDLEFTTYPSIVILKYLGTDIKNKIPVYKFLHADTTLQIDMPCNYPEIIQYSIDVISIDVPEGFVEEGDKRFLIQQQLLNNSQSSEIP